jgi:rhodanese-related sulfurtransferase
MDEVEKLLGAPGVAIFDANNPDLWAKHHLPGAVHITGKDLRSLLPADRRTRLVFYCTNPK